MYVSHQLNLFHDDLLWGKIWDFGILRKTYMYMRIPWKGYTESETIWEWRVKCIYHPHIFCQSMRSHLIYSFQISRTTYPLNPMYSLYPSEGIKLSSVTSGILFFRFEFSMVFIYEVAKAILTNKVESWEISHSHFRSQSVVFPFRFPFNFRGRKFLFRGEEVVIPKIRKLCKITKLPLQV